MPRMENEIDEESVLVTDEATAIDDKQGANPERGAEAKTEKTETLPTEGKAGEKAVLRDSSSDLTSNSDRTESEILVVALQPKNISPEAKVEGPRDADQPQDNNPNEANAEIPKEVGQSKEISAKHVEVLTSSGEESEVSSNRESSDGSSLLSTSDGEVTLYEPQGWFQSDIVCPKAEVDESLSLSPEADVEATVAEITQTSREPKVLILELEPGHDQEGAEEEDFADGKELLQHRVYFPREDAVVVQISGEQEMDDKRLIEELDHHQNITFFTSSVELIPPHLESVVELIVDRYPSLIGISLKASSSVDSILLMLAKKCHQLEYLFLCRSPSYREASLCKLLTACCHLKLLDVSNNKTLSGGCFALLDSQIKVLIAKRCPRINEEGMAILSKGNGRGLATIELGGYFDNSEKQRVDQNKQEQFPNYYAYKLLVDESMANFKWLKHLSLINFKPLVDDQMKMLMVSCKHLEELELDDNTLLTDASMATIGNFWPKLLALKLSFAPQLTDLSLRSMRKLELLQHVSLNHFDSISDEAVLGLLISCYRLRNARFAYRQLASQALNFDHRLIEANVLLFGSPPFPCEIRLERSEDLDTGYLDTYLLVH